MFAPFFRQNIFNNLFFPLLTKKKFLHLMAHMKCIQKVIFMTIKAIPLGKPHCHFKLQNEDNRKRWEMKKKLIKRCICRYNKAYSVFGSSSEANWKTSIFQKVPSICWLLWMRLCFIFIMIAPTGLSEYKVSLFTCNTYNKRHPQFSFSFLYSSQNEKKKANSYGRALAQGN